MSVARFASVFRQLADKYGFEHVDAVTAESSEEEDVLALLDDISILPAYPPRIEILSVKFSRVAGSFFMLTLTVSLFYWIQDIWAMGWMMTIRTRFWTF